MVNILSPSGLEDPIGGEAHSRAMLSRNWGRVNLGLGIVSTVNGTYNVNSINGTSSKFTRIRFGSVGIIVAEFGLDIDTNVISIAASTAAATVLPSFIPVGYRPKTVPHSIPMMGVAPVTNAGSGAQLQWGFNTSGDLLLRNTSASTYTTVSGTDMNFFAVYEWDGTP
jgi:hypothetical protein